MPSVPLVLRTDGTRGWIRTGVTSVVLFAVGGVGVHLALLAGDDPGAGARTALHLVSIVVLLLGGALLVWLTCQPVVQHRPGATPAADEDRSRRARRIAARGEASDDELRDPALVDAVGRRLTTKLLTIWRAGILLLAAGWITLLAMRGPDAVQASALVAPAAGLVVAVVIVVRHRRWRRSERRLAARAPLGGPLS